MPPRDLPAPEARRALQNTDRRGLRHRAGIRAATLAEGLGVPVWRIYEWESGRCLPGGPLLLASYARVLGGLARHEQISSDGADEVEVIPCADTPYRCDGFDPADWPEGEIPDFTLVREWERKAR